MEAVAMKAKDLQVGDIFMTARNSPSCKCGVGRTFRVEAVTRVGLAVRQIKSILECYDEMDSDVALIPTDSVEELISQREAYVNGSDS